MVSTFSWVAAGLLLGQVQAPDAPAYGPSPSGPSPSALRPYAYRGGVAVPLDDGQKPAPSSRKTSDLSNRPILSKIQGWFGKRSNNPAPPPPGALSGTDPTTRVIVAPMMPPAQYPAGTPAPTLAPALGPVPALAPATAPATTPSPFPPSDFPRKLPMSQANKPRPDGLRLPATTGVVGAAATRTTAGTASPIRPALAQRIGRDEKFEWVTGQLEKENGHYVLYYATPETVDSHHGKIALNPARVDMKTFRTGDLVSARGQLHTGLSGPVYHLTSADLIERPKQ